MYFIGNFYLYLKIQCSLLNDDVKTE